MKLCFKCKKPINEKEPYLEYALQSDTITIEPALIFRHFDACTKKSRNPLLKNFLDVFKLYKPEQDIYSFLAEHIEYIDEMDLRLNFFDKALMEIPTLKKSFDKQRS